MDNRAVVHAADIASTKLWRFQGTNILVSDVKRDYLDGQERVRDGYHALGLTDAEIDGALAFELPPVTGVEIAPNIVGFEVQGVCGERRRIVANSPPWEPDHCIRGRMSRVSVAVEFGQSVPMVIGPNGGS